MNNCQFKFKPDKIKYLSNIDTLDSTHKKTIDNINKKHAIPDAFTLSALPTAPGFET